MNVSSLGDSCERSGAAAKWRHQELASEFRRRISEGEFRVSDALPTERAIAQSAGVSRATVREALRILEAQGMIRRRQGSGTIVTSERPRRFHQPVESLEALLSYPPNTWVRLDDVDFGDDDAGLRAELDPDDGRDWRRITLRRYITGLDLPISLSRAYVPADFVDVAERVGTTDAPVYRLVEEQFGVLAADIALRIDAVATPPDIAGPLQLEPGSPATRIVRVYRDANGVVMNVSITIHPAGRYVFEASLHRDTAQS